MSKVSADISKLLLGVAGSDLDTAHNHSHVASLTDSKAIATDTDTDVTHDMPPETSLVLAVNNPADTIHLSHMIPKTLRDIGENFEALCERDLSWDDLQRLVGTAEYICATMTATIRADETYQTLRSTCDRNDVHSINKAHHESYIHAKSTMKEEDWKILVALHRDRTRLGTAKRNRSLFSEQLVVGQKFGRVALSFERRFGGEAVFVSLW